MEEKKIQKTIKEVAKRGDLTAAKVGWGDGGSTPPQRLPPLRNLLGFWHPLTARLGPAPRPPSAQHLAKEIVHSRKAVARIYTNRAHMMGIGTALTEQLGAWCRPPGGGGGGGAGFPCAPIATWHGW